ncbi:ChbG/HpnK family deacetylase, partial [archaeon]|nr:ChbG/HpnK family deacetylase [archaeon]
HVHGFLPILSIFIDLMKEYHIPALRHSPAGYTLTTRRPIPYDESEYRAVEERLLQEKLFFCGTMAEGAGRIDEIASFPAELVVHPSLGGDPWRTAELEILLSDSFRTALEDRGMQPVSYQDLLGEAQGS